MNLITTIILSSVLAMPVTTVQNVELPNKEMRLIEQGEIVVNEIQNNLKGQTFEAYAIFPASPEITLKALQSYKDYPDFMPNVTRVEIVHTNGKQAIIDQTLGLPLGTTKRYRLDTSIEQQDGKIKMTWRMINWPEIKKDESIGDTHGYWLLLPHRETQTLAVYHNYTDPGEVPFGMGWIVEYLSGKSIKDILGNTRLYIEQHKGKLSND